MVYNRVPVKLVKEEPYARNTSGDDYGPFLRDRRPQE
jgi:hypothetical protein